MAPVLPAESRQEETSGVTAQEERHHKTQLNFSVGSPFSIAVDEAARSKRARLKGSVGWEGARLHVAEGAMLRIHTASLSLDAGASISRSGDFSATLLFSSDENKAALPLCPFVLDGVTSAAAGAALVVTSLGVDVCGPRTVKLGVDVVRHPGKEMEGRRQRCDAFSINVFGSVVPCPWKVDRNGSTNVDGLSTVVTASLLITAEESETTISRKRKDMASTDFASRDIETSKLPKTENLMTYDTADNSANISNNSSMNSTENLNNRPARKDSITQHATIPPDGASKASLNRKQARKARKKLAKQKQKELQEVLAKEKGYDCSTTIGTEKGSGTDSRSGAIKNKANIPSSPMRPLSERRLKCGVIVKDIIIGNGPAVKAGRKVSILYQGSFPDGTVFDKSNSRRSPLQFRVGTGEVIRGLDVGMEGMREGGERSIVIPPNMAYGKHGSKGNGGYGIPGDATLVFDVQLLSSSKPHKK